MRPPAPENVRLSLRAALGYGIGLLLGLELHDAVRRRFPPELDVIDGGAPVINEDALRRRFEEERGETEGGEADGTEA